MARIAPCSQPGTSPHTTVTSAGSPTAAASATGSLAQPGHHERHRDRAEEILTGLTGTVALVLLGAEVALAFSGGLPGLLLGLATGLTSMTQQVAISVGIPVLSAIATTQSMELTGTHLALGVDVVATLASVVPIWAGPRPARRPTCAPIADPVQFPQP